MLPHDTVSACPGEQLTFMCTTNATSIRWNVTVPLLDTSDGTQFDNWGSEIVSHVQTRMASPIRINSNVSFTVSRLSTSGALPLISTLSVTNLMNILNGTRVECFTRIDNVGFERMTTIYVIRSGGNGKQMLPSLIPRRFKRRRRKGMEVHIARACAGGPQKKVE